MEKILKHRYVPKHTIIDEEEVSKLLKEFNISKTQLPKIHTKDPIVMVIGASKGDVIKIERKSYTAKKMLNYRCVVDA